MTTYLPTISIILTLKAHPLANHLNYTFHIKRISKGNTLELERLCKFRRNSESPCTKYPISSSAVYPTVLMSLSVENVHTTWFRSMSRSTILLPARDMRYGNGLISANEKEVDSAHEKQASGHENPAVVKSMGHLRLISRTRRHEDLQTLWARVSSNYFDVGKYIPILSDLNF